MTTRLPEHALIEALLQSPRLPAVAERIDALLSDEAAPRAHFIDTVLESEKAVSPAKRR